MKPKACKVCRVKFEPARPLQTTCGVPCAIQYGSAQLAKRQAKEAQEQKRKDKAKREALKPRSHWIALAQKAVNRYVRARDFYKGCVSCHLPASWDGQWHASHFRSTAAASSVRFHLWNVHKACSVCNNHKSGNLAGYTPRLVALIGQERVDWLMAQNQRANYSTEYLQRLASVFNRKAARQERRNAF